MARSRGHGSWFVHRYRLGYVGLGVVGTLLVLGPLAMLVVDPLGAVGQSSPVSPLSPLTEPHLRVLLWRTLRIAGWVTFLALLMGAGLGLWLSRRRGLRATLLAGLHVLPLCLPPYISALAWARAFGRDSAVARVFGADAGAWCSRWFYSETGVIFCLTLVLCPVVTLLTAAALRAIDPGRVEAGRLARGTWATTLRVELPLALPGLGAGALLVFVLAVGEVAVPQLLRVPVYTTVVFSRLADLSFQPGEALALAGPVIAMGVAVAYGLHLLDREGRRSRGLRRHPGGSAPFRTLSLGADLLAFSIVSASLIPILLLLSTASHAPGGGWNAVASAAPALGNSLRYAAVTATVMAGAALLFSALWCRRPRATGWLVLPLLLGLVLPSAVLALGLVSTWNRPATQWIYRSDVIIVLGLCARYLYLPLRLAKLGQDQLRPGWLEAAQLTGASWFHRLMGVRLPLLGETLVITWCVGFLLTLRDLETIIPFYPPGGESLPVRTMTLEANSPPGLTASTAALQVGITAALVIVVAGVAWVGARRSERASP